jgi:acetylglutamate/LysW-gamma-L-alpha-aminoadipate kinase
MIPVRSLRRLIKPAYRLFFDMAQGRMKKKVMGASEALAQGVETVILGDARLDHPVQLALEGRGTVIR